MTKSAFKTTFLTDLGHKLVTFDLQVYHQVESNMIEIKKWVIFVERFNIELSEWFLSKLLT